MTPSRRQFTLVFTATLAAVFLIVTGLIGYEPPAHLSLDPATWRRGIWTDHVILAQVVLGLGLLTVAFVIALGLKRRLATDVPAPARWDSN